MRECGYLIRLFLAGKCGRPADDRAAGDFGEPGPVLSPITDFEAIQSQEKHFVVYAWPVEVNKTGWRTFVVNEENQVYATKGENGTYSGPWGPSLEAAFNAKGDGRDGWFNDELGGVGNDGNTWKPVD